MEIKIPLGGNRFPVWKSKSSTMETFLRFGGRKKSGWKRSSSLEEKKNRDGNAPQIWRKKIIVVGVEIPSLARQKSLTKIKTQGCSINLKVTFLQSTIWRKPI